MARNDEHYVVPARAQDRGFFFGDPRGDRHREADGSACALRDRYELSELDFRESGEVERTNRSGLGRAGASLRDRNRNGGFGAVARNSRRASGLRRAPACRGRTTRRGASGRHRVADGAETTFANLPTI